MTVPVQETRFPHTGNGVTVEFAYGCQIQSPSDLVVSIDGAIATNGFTVSGVGAATGGSVAFTTAPANGVEVLLERIIKLERTTDYQQNGDFLARVVNPDFDRLWMALQQFESLLGAQSGAVARALLLGRNDTNGSGAYRALQNRIQDLADPVGQQDATNKRWVQTQLAGFLADGAGQFVLDLLAAPDGASGVGYGTTTVSGQLDADAAELAQHANDIATNVTAIATNKSDLAVVRNTIVGTNLAPLVVDLHFGTLCGTGWLGDATELGGYTPTPTTASAATSATGTTITVVDPTIFRQGQLICYLAPSLTWYSAIIDSISGSVLTLDRQLPEGISIGASVIYFYANDAHPNQYGYNTIVDDAIRQLSKKEEIAYVGRNYEIWTAVASATVAGVTLGTVSAASYLIPGATVNADRAALVTCTDANQGASSDWVSLTAGEYNTHLVLNSGERSGGFSGAVQVSIEELRTDGIIYAIATRTISGYSGARSVDITYKTSPGSAIRARVVSSSGGGATFYLGKLTHGKIIEHPTSLNHGTHVLLGDSWFASGFLMSRLQARLPLATFINAGVSGNRASQLLTRFDTDVAPTGANFVWVMCGTNDYYADVTASLFEQQINQVTGLIQGIGAQPINWTASVGDALYAVTPFERLTVSRQYAVEVNYHGHTAAPDWIGSKYRTANLFANAVSIPAGGSVVLGATPGKTYLPAFIRTLYTSGAALNIWVGYAGIIDGTTLVDQSAFASATDIKNTVLTRADTAPRYVIVVANNPSGSPIVTSMVADIAWVQA